MKNETLAILGCTLLWAACEAPTAKLLDGDGEASDRRLRRMNLTVEVPSNELGEWIVQEGDEPVGAVLGYTEAHCSWTVTQEPALDTCPTVTDPCGVRVCDSQAHLCRALVLREMAAGVTPVVLVDGNGDDAYRIPPQDAESRVALEQAAEYEALQAIVAIRLALADDFACNAARLDDAVGAGDEGSGTLAQTTGEFLAASLVEALDVGEAAAEAATRGALDIADRDLSAISDRGRASRLAWFDDNLSRAIALQTQVGGVLVDASATSTQIFSSGEYQQDPDSPTYADLTSLGIGSQQPCRGQCAVALQLLRLSGAPFDEVIDDGSTTSLSSLILNEVGPRLAERFNDSSLSTSDEQLAAHFGLGVANLREARSWMRQEAITLARPNDLDPADPPPLAPEADDTPRTAIYEYDATTLAMPQRPPLAHFQTAAQRSSVWFYGQKDVSQGESIRPIERPERAYLFDIAHSLARETIARDRGDATAQGILATLVRQGNARRAARTEVCSRYSTPDDEWRVRVFGVPEAELALASGTTQLRCAEDGRVEGYPCELSPVTVSSGPTEGNLLMTASPYAAGWENYVEWTISVSRPGGTLPPAYPNMPHLYVMRLRPDRQGGPGSYESIGGVTWNIPDTGQGEWADCTTIPWDVLTDIAAERAFSPNETDLEPEDLCGVPDGPIPLEDEIIDDSDAYEDSWQHHLRVAAATADHADALGQQLIESGLELDRRAESAVDEIQSLCGVAVNLDGLFAGPGGGLADLVDSAAGCPGTPCPAGYECLGSSCVLESFFPSMDDRFDREALEACLGLSGQSTVPVVALGSTPLCVHREINAPEILCADAESGTCPSPEPAGGCPSVPSGDESLLLSNDDGDALVEVLELFSANAPDGSPTGTSTAIRPGSECESLRYLRNLEGVRPSDTDREIIGQIVRSGFFDYENVRYWAGRIGWRAYPGDYSEITVDGDVWENIGTGLDWGGTGYPFGDDGAGRIAGPASGRWPCDQQFPTGVCAPLAPGTGEPTDRSVFCQFVDCSTSDSRAPMNRRIGRAVATLRALSGIGLDDVWMPAWYRHSVYVPGPFRTVSDEYSLPWLVAVSAPMGTDGHPLGGLVVVPGVSGGVEEVWRSTSDTGVQVHIGDPDEVSTVRPFGFVSFGASYRDDNEGRARAIARELWSGLSRSTAFIDPGNTFGDVSLFGECSTCFGPTWASERQRIFYRALVETGQEEDFIYLRSGRDDVTGETPLDMLTNLFSHDPFDLNGGLVDNEAHLFEGEAPEGSFEGAAIRRRDLLDAMEMMCQVALTDSPASVRSCSSPPPVYGVDSVRSVQHYIACIANRLDDLAERQVVQDLPVDVVAAVRNESGDIRPDLGEYGALVVELRQALRGQARAPREIARQLREASGEIEILEAQQRIFNRERTIEWLRNLSTVVETVATCASGSSYGASCAVAASQLAIALSVTSLVRDNIADRERIAFQQFRDSMSARIDALAGLEEQLRDGTDSVAGILARLRERQATGQTALARALFQDSDEAGRHYAVNTVMRRIYDINLQRYLDARRGAVRAAVVARRAVEQRFGADLADVDCSSLVDPPSDWASDLCSSEGINYGELRDPDVPLTEEAIRGLFIGDYVRRLEQWVESYRFDFPYTSSEDTMVVSLRDDVIRARGVCAAEADSLLGKSNDLTAPLLPERNGSSASASVPAWGVPIDGCDPGMDPEIVNCVHVQPIDGPTIYSTTPPGPPVSGAIDGMSPHGFRVQFAPDTGTSHYTDDAAWVQEVTLGPGVYQLSWYQRTSPAPEPVVDARVPGLSLTASAVFDASGSTEPMLETDWMRHFQFFQVPSTVDGGTAVVSVGVYPDPMEMSIHAQSIDVAGIQVENVTSTVGTRDWVAADQMDVDAEQGVFYPGLFVATTAQGFARYEQCLSYDPAQFVEAWTYRCERLCTGGFDRCSEGEDPQTYCFWEASFDITEDRLLGRGATFGGGFAFGNYNYRSGSVAVNLVGTGVRSCDGPDSRTCYTTAATPFSLYHLPLGHGADDGAYTVSTHDGELFPVHLFEGRIESGRALAAERYLTNPLSSADASLIASYRHGELRGRPIPGHYIMRIWDVAGLDFGAVEDVQVIWDYRYFTRTGSPFTCSED